MLSEDIQIVSKLGQSLWSAPDQCQKIVRETVAAVTILDSHPAGAIEKSCQALLDRANLKGFYHRHPSGLNALFPEERFILLALHDARWTYARIGRVIRETVEVVQQLAWNARIFVAAKSYPAAPVSCSPGCPEYDPQKPWTQKFLDEEMKGEENLFLQQHLTQCQGCRDGLMRAKEVYYEVEKKIRGSEADWSSPELTAQLRTLVHEGERILYPSTATPREALSRFFSRRQTQLILLAWALTLFALVKFHLG